MEGGLRSVASCARQGASWGAKIRLPHALIMTMLFHKGTLRQKLRRIIDMALLHTRNLAMYAAVYKATLVALSAARPPLFCRRDSIGIDTGGGNYRSGNGGSCTHSDLPEDGKTRQSVASWHPLVAGGLGGYLVWGRYNGVNYQITLYVLSRVVISALRLCAKSGANPWNRVSFEDAYPYGSAVCWGAVMYLWEFHPELVQSSMKRSMDFIYRDGERWRGFRENLIPSKECLLTLGGAAMLKLWDKSGRMVVGDEPGGSPNT